MNRGHGQICPLISSTQRSTRETGADHVRFFGYEEQQLREERAGVHKRDFIGWADVFADPLADGHMRSDPSALAEKTWDLAVWL